MKPPLSITGIATAFFGVVIASRTIPYVGEFLSHNNRLVILGEQLAFPATVALLVALVAPSCLTAIVVSRHFANSGVSGVLAVFGATAGVWAFLAITASLSGYASSRFPALGNGNSTSLVLLGFYLSDSGLTSLSLTDHVAETALLVMPVVGAMLMTIASNYWVNSFLKGAGEPKRKSAWRRYEVGPLADGIYVLALIWVTTLVSFLMLVKDGLIVAPIAGIGAMASAILITKMSVSDSRLLFSPKHRLFLRLFGRFARLWACALLLTGTLLILAFLEVFDALPGRWTGPVFFSGVTGGAGITFQVLYGRGRFPIS